MTCPHHGSLSSYCLTCQALSQGAQQQASLANQMQSSALYQQQSDPWATIKELRDENAKLKEELASYKKKERIATLREKIAEMRKELEELTKTETK